MNMLAPVRRDRVISDLPLVSWKEGHGLGVGSLSCRATALSPFVPAQCFRKEAALHTRPAFHPTAASACQEQRTGTVG